MDESINMLFTLFNLAYKYLNVPQSERTIY